MTDPSDTPRLNPDTAAMSKNQILNHIKTWKRWTDWRIAFSGFSKAQWNEWGGFKEDSWSPLDHFTTILELLPETPISSLLVQAFAEMIKGSPMWNSHGGNRGHMSHEKVYLTLLRAFFIQDEVFNAPQVESTWTPPLMTPQERIAAYLIMRMTSQGPGALNLSVLLSLEDQLKNPSPPVSVADEVESLVEHVWGTYQEGPIHLTPEIIPSKGLGPVQEAYPLNPPSRGAAVNEEWDVVPFKAN